MFSGRRRADLWHAETAGAPAGPRPEGKSYAQPGPAYCQPPWKISRYVLSPGAECQGESGRSARLSIALLVEPDHKFDWRRGGGGFAFSRVGAGAKVPVRPTLLSALRIRQGQQLAQLRL